MDLENTFIQGVAGNTPLALALVYAFNRIEQKLDLVVKALGKNHAPKP